MNADQRGLCLTVAGVLRPLLSRASSGTGEAFNVTEARVRASSGASYAQTIAVP